MPKTLFVIGLIFFIGSIILIVANCKQVNIDKYGKVVKMRIVRLPSSCFGSAVRYFVTYSYNGKLYEKATRGDFCKKHYVGELIDMKYLKGYKTILRPNESAYVNLGAFAILGLFGLGVIISQWKKIMQ